MTNQPTNTPPGSGEQSTERAPQRDANERGTFNIRARTSPSLPSFPTYPALPKSSLGSDSTPTSRNAPPERSTVDEPRIDTPAASPAVPVNPVPSLRPVEELQFGLWEIMLDHFPHQNSSFIAECRTMLARLRAAEETLARASSLDTLFDVLLEAQYGGLRPGAEEREAVAQLAEAVQPLLRAALAEGASR